MSPDESGGPSGHGAGDFLAPVLFTLIAAVRREAERVASVEPDPEAIHDFRVALRRLRTVLRPARRVFGSRRLRALGAELRRFARATGALRDEEVLRETLATLDLPPRARPGLDAWMAQRAGQERARRRRASTLVAGIDPSACEPALGEVLAHLEHRLGHRRSGEPPTGVLAEAALERAAAGVVELLGAQPTDAVEMHALRICYKRLRYTAELFSPVLGERADTAAKAAARMQKRLGELHDLDEALARIHRARSLPSLARAATARALRRARAERCAAIRRDLVEERARLADRLRLAPR
jgi:CHAD domain-containing protein